jgi:hypothetical protein
MMHISRALGTSLLVLTAGSALAGQDPIRLTVDSNTQTLQMQTAVPGTGYLVLGPWAVPPINLAGIELNVAPQHLLPLGSLQANQAVTLFVPRMLSALNAEAVLVDATLQVHDSNVVPLLHAFPDLVAATFRAQLVSTDSIPPLYTVGISLTAPTSGYELRFDAFQLDAGVMRVYFRLIEPGEGEIVIPVLTEHEQAVDLGSEVGNRVDVYLMRVQRGQVGGEVYRLMASLPVESQKG